MAPETSPSTTRRLFFALWPEIEVGRKLALMGREVQKACGGRAMKRETLHLTLAFLGNVASERAEVAMEAAAGVGGKAFDHLLDRLECWRHNRIVWVGPSVPPPALSELAANLGRALGVAGFALEKRPFAAHITLLRNARCPESLPPPEPIPWPVKEFVLVESKLSAQGAAYEIVSRWPLVTEKK